MSPISHVNRNREKRFFLLLFIYFYSIQKIRLYNLSIELDKLEHNFALFNITLYFKTIQKYLLVSTDLIGNKIIKNTVCIVILY